uniref:Uncharacterized protein n=1 Tax=Heterorhabditis bacteriophora TaxID=37862 RepID=A0A1I7X9T2_HETBA
MLTTTKIPNFNTNYTITHQKSQILFESLLICSH